MLGEDIPDLLVFKPTSIPDTLPIPQAHQPVPDLKDDSLPYIGASKTLRSDDHRYMVMKFVRSQYHNARFRKIYDASIDGWSSEDFHRCCDKQGWTLTIV